MPYRPQKELKKMEFEIKAANDLQEIYACMAGIPFPYNYAAGYDAWERSYLSDIDGGGRRLFRELTTLGAYCGGAMAGFVQYGRTAFGFAENGELSGEISYSVIRCLYFPEGRADAGGALLGEALRALSGNARIYAFFHYFGMSCYARHGKLSERLAHIHALLLERGFSVEHENVFYSSRHEACEGAEGAEVALRWHEETAGGQRYCDFIMGGAAVGGCEVHFLEQRGIAYLRWIYINEELCNRGIGTTCMKALKRELYARGITRFDTDTALANKRAQRFYEKNGFTNEGLTRSYVGR